MDDTELIKLLENQKNDLKDYIAMTGTATRAKFTSEIDRVDEADKHRNRIIEKHTTALKELRFFQVIGRHPIKASIAFMILIMIGAYCYHKIDKPATLEKTTGIVIEKDGTLQ